MNHLLELLITEQVGYSRGQNFETGLMLSGIIDIGVVLVLRFNEVIMGVLMGDV